jgi:hypothetical protein
MKARNTLKFGLFGLFLGVLLLSPTIVFSQEDGGVVSPILSYSVGARGYSMGGAFTALADDTTASWWNPAGLVEIHRQEIAAYFESLYVGSTLAFLGYSYPIWNVGVASGSVMYLGTSDIPGFSEPSLGVHQQTANYSAYQLLINLSFAQKLSFYKKFAPFLKYFDAGATLKFLTAGTTSVGRFGVGLDLGLKYYPTHITDPKWEWFKNFVFALKINNALPPTVQFNSQRDWYIWDLNLGILYRTLYDTLNLELDFKQTLFRNTPPQPRIGAEYTIYRIVKVRAGFIANVSTPVPTGEFAAGLGLNFEDFRFDYAFGYNFDLGAVHHISATYSFGEIIP